MKDFVKRNMPIFVIGGITLVTFVGIIFLASRNQPDKPYLVKVDESKLFSDYTPTLGNPDAKVTLVEFSDFECPACASFNPIVKRIIEENRNDIKFGYRHFPLPQHVNSVNSAVAAVAAGEQGKFFEYGDKLFANQSALSNDDLLRYAQELGLDMSKFEKDIKNNELKQRVNDDTKLGLELKINSTPSFILNGTLMDFQNLAEFETMILDEIGKFTDKNVNSDLTIDADVGDTEPQPIDDSGKIETPPAPVVPDTPQVKEITYGDNGFLPDSTSVPTNTIIKFINSSTRDIKLKELTKLYNELSTPVEIKAGATFEFTVTKPYLFTYEEETSKDFGKIMVLDRKKSPDNQN